MSLSTSFPPTITSKVSAKKSMFSNLARMVSTGRSVGSRGKRARRGAQPGFGGRQPGTKPKRRSLGAGGEPQRSGPGSSTQDAGTLHDGLPGHQSSFTAPRCPTATVADPFPDTAAEEDRAGVGTLLCRTAGEEREALCAELTQSGPAHALTSSTSAFLLSGHQRGGQHFLPQGRAVPPRHCCHFGSADSLSCVLPSTSRILAASLVASH